MSDPTPHTDSLSEKINLLCQVQFKHIPEKVTIIYHPTSISIILEHLVDFADQRLPLSPDKRYNHVYILLKDFIAPIIQRELIKMKHKNVLCPFIDWKKNMNRACLIFVFKDWSEAVLKINYEGKEQLQEQITSRIEKSQKAPPYIESFWINHDNLMIIRNNSLFDIEKNLIYKGHLSKLKLSKKESELNVFTEELNFQSILQRTLDTAYLDWNFGEDLNILLLSFK